MNHCGFCFIMYALHTCTNAQFVHTKKKLIEITIIKIITVVEVLKKNH